MLTVTWGLPKSRSFGEVKFILRHTVWGEEIDVNTLYQKLQHLFLNTINLILLLDYILIEHGFFNIVF